MCSLSKEGEQEDVSLCGFSCVMVRSARNSDCIANERYRDVTPIDLLICRQPPAFIDLPQL